MHENRGITLVALVITIVVLLILAGISIQAITNTGLFEKTKKAKQESLEKQEEENMTLANYENEINSVVSGSRDETKSGTIDITKNGEYDVSEYSKAMVNVVTKQPEEIISYKTSDKDNFISTYTATEDCVVLATSMAMHSMKVSEGRSTTNQISPGTVVSEVSELRTTMPAQYIQRLYKLSSGQSIQCVSSAYYYGIMCHTFVVYK